MGLKDIFKKKSAPAKAPADKKKKKEVQQEVKKKPTVQAASKPKKVKQEKPSTKVKVNKEDTKNAYRVLVRAMITEKATEIGQFNQYVFEVYRDANKYEIKKAIKSVYGVTPIKVNIMNAKGKEVKWGRTTGKTAASKKAIVFLNKNDKIEIGTETNK